MEDQVALLGFGRQFYRRAVACLPDLAAFRVTLTNLGSLTVILSQLFPSVMTYMFLYPIFRLLFGTLYPAYASYKAVRTKNVKEYVKWMMYWIVFALFTCAETFTDVFLSFWFPFYYEIKIILVLWLLSPATKGSSILYRKFVHPMLSRREQDIDEYIAKAKEQGYHTVLHLGTKGVNYATTVIMQTAIKGGGGLVQQLRRSYSLSDLSTDKDMADVNRNSKALSNIPDDDIDGDEGSVDPRLLRPRGYSPRRSASGSGRVEMYFPEVDVDVRQHSTRQREPSIPLSHIRSSEDVSSGYSSAEPLYAGHHPAKTEGLVAGREPLVRTASVGSTRSMRPKSSRGGVMAKRTPVSEDSDPWREEEAEFESQEENLIVSSSLPLHLPSITTPERSLTQSELLYLLQQLQSSIVVPGSGCVPCPPTSNSSAAMDERRLLEKAEDVELTDESELYVDADVVVSVEVMQDATPPPPPRDIQSSETNTEGAPPPPPPRDIQSSETNTEGAPPEDVTDEVKDECENAFSEESTSDAVTSECTLLANVTDSHEDSLPEDEPGTPTVPQGSDPGAVERAGEKEAPSCDVTDTAPSDHQHSRDFSLPAEVGSEKSASCDVPDTAPSDHQHSRDFSLPAEVGSEKNDNRSGRYNKRPAPEPPKKEPDMSHDVDLESPQTAVKACLVLQPKIVKSYDPEFRESQGQGMKTEKLTPPKAKHRGLFHSKSKQRGSAFSRLLVMPRNQLGHFVSLLPFWHSRDPRAQAVGNEDDMAEGENVSLSRDTRAIPSSSCSLEYLPCVGTGHEYKSAMSREKSNSISDFKLREMSHSPPSARKCK